MRKKETTKENILEGAYQLMISEGFSQLTARKIAKKISISTQPIYLNFDNMKVLKDTLFLNTMENVERKFFKDTQSITEFALSYYHFANAKHDLFLSLITDKETILPTYQFFYKLFRKGIWNDTVLSDKSSKIIYARTIGVITSIVHSDNSNIDEISMEKLISELIIQDIATLQNNTF